MLQAEVPKEAQDAWEWGRKSGPRDTMLVLRASSASLDLAQFLFSECHAA